MINVCLLYKNFATRKRSLISNACPNFWIINPWSDNIISFHTLKKCFTALWVQPVPKIKEAKIIFRNIYYSQSSYNYGGRRKTKLLPDSSFEKKLCTSSKSEKPIFLFRPPMPLETDRG